MCHCPANETLRYAVWDSLVASKGYSAYIDTMFTSPLLRCVNLMTMELKLRMIGCSHLHVVSLYMANMYL